MHAYLVMFAVPKTFSSDEAVYVASCYIYTVCASVTTVAMYVHAVPYCFVCKCGYVCSYVFMYVYVCIHICIYVYVYMYTCVYVLSKCKEHREVI